MAYKEKHILLNPLSNREKEALWLIGSGATNNEAATEMGISCRTVNNHIVNSKKRLRNFGIVQYKEDQGSRITIRKSPLTIYSAGMAAEHGLIKPLPTIMRDQVKMAELLLTKDC